jgi:hypothetical protein
MDIYAVLTKKGLTMVARPFPELINGILAFA